MKFSLFRKPKEEPQPTIEAKEETKPEVASAPEEPSPQTPVAEEPVQEAVPETQAEPAPEPKEEPKQEAPAEPASKTYLKAMPLKDLADVEKVKTEVNNGNIIILRVTPLAAKSIEDVKNAVNHLFEFTESVGGDIARLGEERVVICPKNIRIWREKSAATANPIPTAAPTAA
jgi:SepF-like predicted cell division protein (DUF552 family)